MNRPEGATEQEAPSRSRFCGPAIELGRSSLIAIAPSNDLLMKSIDLPRPLSLPLACIVLLLLINVAGGSTTNGALVPMQDDATSTRPNIIIVQPDDMFYYDEWGRPPNSPNDPFESIPFPAYGLPNLETLRLNGIQMMQAYTASPMCGTSRFATMTSRYPSRAVSNDGGDSPPDVVIPKTKLEGDDCSKNNLAVQFRDAGYRTAMIGKWHLSYIDKDYYTYASAVDTVKGCGFDTVEGLYVENLKPGNSLNAYSDGTFSHNMEWLTSEALKVIEEDSAKPFFLYFNPTVPHASNSIASALTDFSCRDTAAGTLDADPIIPGMTDGGCESYRQTIFDRGEDEDDKDLGAIWLDDSVGALLRSLESTGKLADTIFVFQQDHGINPKGSLYEGGTRIPQFIHYPAAINAGAQLVHGVSVVDVGATLLDYALITPSYEIDGLSWRTAIASDESSVKWEDRCLYFELEQDRAVRCGCFKLLTIFDEDESTTHLRGARHGLANDKENLFDLCLGSDSYANEIVGDNAEAVNVIQDNPLMASNLMTLHNCHLDRIAAADFSLCQSSFNGTAIGVPSASHMHSVCLFTSVLSAALSFF